MHTYKSIQKHTCIYIPSCIQLYLHVYIFKQHICMHLLSRAEIFKMKYINPAKTVCDVFFFSFFFFFFGGGGGVPRNSRLE